MNAVDYINKNLDPMVLLEYYSFREITESDNQIRACCEIHRGNNPTAFIWNKDNNLWFCYTGDDCHGGDAITLVEKMEKVDFITAIKRVAEILSLDIDGMSISMGKSIIIKDFEHWKKLQTKTAKVDVNFTMPETTYYDTLDSFTRFKPETLEYFGAKFCKLLPLEDKVLYNKLVIPLYNDNKLCGVALRDTSGSTTHKWYYAPTGLHIRNLLYNFDNAIEHIDKNELNEIILVEGIFDVWAYHEAGIHNVVAVFGSSLKDEQYNTLIKSGLNLVTSFDSDDAGRKCTKEVISKFKYKATIRTVQIPEGKDPADISREELQQAYLARA